jgi:hypothetical protein
MESPSNESEPSESRTFITTGGMKRPERNLSAGKRKASFPKEPGSIKSDSDGDRREGGRAGAGSSEEREGRERMEERV